ncbi:hypothetical protein ACHAXH_001395 [Discostella pseudostelligera]
MSLSSPWSQSRPTSGATPTQIPKAMESAIPHINDVLFGRGTSVNLHPGNRQFRSLVESNKLTFMKAKKNKQKRAVAAYIYNEIQSMRPPG